jgi:AmmeMemoRadiSam system protein B
VGDATAAEVSEVLEQLWGDSGTLLVISSDLSHYLDYDSAKQRDAATCRAIESLAYEKLGYHDACGRNPVCGLLHYARNHNLTVKTLDLRNSGDTAGPHDRVVGYGTWVLTE